MSPWQWALLGSNLLALLLMGVDKSRACRHRRRVSERALFFFPVFGGALGGTLGMLLFHHKTRKKAFAWGFPLLALSQLLILLYLTKPPI